MSGKREKEMILKECRKCGENKPATKEYFYANKGTADKLGVYCKDCQKKILQEWKEKNPNKVKKNRVKHNSKPKTKLLMQKANARNFSLKSQREYRAKREKVDVGFKIQRRIRSRIAVVVKRCNAQKSDRTINLIGCSVNILKTHLEKQFTEGMTWENYGEWHVDHIIPCAAFDFTKKEDQLKCFNYKNLQPLWAYDNKSKGAKYDETLINKEKVEQLKNG